MLEITARDVIGTAQASLHVATAELRALLNSNELPTDKDFLEITHLINIALSDVLLAQHQMSSDWTDTIYVGRWNK